MKDILLVKIKLFMIEHTYAPSYKEMCHMMKCSKNTIFHLLRKLRESGEIDFVNGESRTITIKGWDYKDKGDLINRTL